MTYSQVQVGMSTVAGRAGLGIPDSGKSPPEVLPEKQMIDHCWERCVRPQRSVGELEHIVSRE